MNLQLQPGPVCFARDFQDFLQRDLRRQHDAADAQIEHHLKIPGIGHQGIRSVDQAVLESQLLRGQKNRRIHIHNALGIPDLNLLEPGFHLGKLLLHPQAVENNLPPKSSLLAAVKDILSFRFGKEAG